MKKTLAYILAMLMMLTMLPTVALAAGGSGTKADPYLVGVEGELTSAFAAGGYIKLTGDIALGDFTGNKFVIADGKAVTLDLNGKTIGGHASDENVGTSILWIKGNSSLAINDSSSGQTGKITISDTGVQKGTYGVGIFTLKVTHGTIIVNGGTIENTGTTDVPYSIDVYASEGDGTLIVNGGKIISAKAAIRAATPNAAYKSTVTINSGFVQGGTSGIWIQQDGLQNGSAAVAVHGGVVRGVKYNAIYADAKNDDTDEIEIIVTDGVLTNNSATSATVEFSTGDGKIEITGGTIFNTVQGGTTVATTGDGSNVTVKDAKLSSIPSIAGAAIQANTVVTVLPLIANDETLVKAGVDPTFMIIIPTAVDFGTLAKNDGTKTKAFDVAASGVLIEDGSQIQVSVVSGFVMKDKDGAGNIELAYVLNNAQGQVSTAAVFANFVENRTEGGTVTVDTAAITKAGSYKGTMVFGISYVPPTLEG